MEQPITSFEAGVRAHPVNGDTSVSAWAWMEIEGMGALTMAPIAVRRWKERPVVRDCR